MTAIHRERVLPVNGRVLVRNGQKVNAMDTIAEATVAPEHLILNIARSLKISTEKADQLVQYKAGDKVSAGDILAGPVGLTRRVIRAPSAGVVLVVGEGQVILEVSNPPFQLRAGIPGFVDGIIPDRGVMIKTTGSLVQGVWGNGHEDFGLLNVLIRNKAELLTPDQLDVSLRGSIVVGGYCGNAEVFQAADELPVRGLILASMDSALIPVALERPYPVLILEGFGNLPLNVPTLNLISTSSRREAAIFAVNPAAHLESRPEIIIPLPTMGDVSEPLRTAFLSPGQRVRIIREPHRSELGTLVALISRPVEFPSGLKLPAARVRLENGEIAIVPQANLEVLDCQT
jgi:hypothetical protein